jgi:Gas vesicle synthesis protein GvpO
MPERRTTRTGRRPVTRQRPRPDDERADEELEPDGEPADEDLEPADDEPADEDLEPADDESAVDEEPADEEPSDEEPEPAKKNRGGMSAVQAARSGLRSLTDLIGKRPEGVTSVEPTDDGWRVGVEVVEDRRVPSTADVLAIYEVSLDADGTLLSYRRVRRYPRSQGNDGGER